MLKICFGWLYRGKTSYLQLRVNFELSEPFLRKLSLLRRYYEICVKYLFTSSERRTAPRANQKIVFNISEYLDSLQTD